MACCVPNCDSSYWNKTCKLTLFTPTTERRLELWQEILRREVGLEKLERTDRICILHFSEDVIERERTVFERGGIIYKVPRRRPILSDCAVPEIFIERCCKKKKKTGNFESLGPEILAQQRKMFQEYQDGINSVDDTKKVKKKVPIKRRVEGDFDVTTGDMKNVMLKKNNLYEHIVDAINYKETISKHFNKLWIPNTHNDGYASWTLWKEDCSGVYKRIVLHKNLKVDVYVNGELICLPEISKITGMCDFQKFIRAVTQITPCMRVEGYLGEE